jgi:hypothetical protein
MQKGLRVIPENVSGKLVQDYDFSQGPLRNLSPRIGFTGHHGIVAIQEFIADLFIEVRIFLPML